MTIHHGRLAVALAAATALLATMTACSGDDPPEPASTTSSPSITTPAATTTPPVLSQTQRDIAAADKAVRAFYATQDRLFHDKELPIGELLRVSRGDSYTKWSAVVRGERIRGHKQIGETQLVTVTGQFTEDSTRPTVVVSVCYDVSRVNVVDPSGKSVVSPSRVNRGKAAFTVQQWPDGWYVTKDSSRGKPC